MIGVTLILTYSRGFKLIKQVLLHFYRLLNIMMKFLSAALPSFSSSNYEIDKNIYFLSNTYVEIVTLYLLIIFVYLANDRKPTYFTFLLIERCLFIDYLLILWILLSLFLIILDIFLRILRSSENILSVILPKVDLSTFLI